jgi:hypothetical protein
MKSISLIANPSSSVEGTSSVPVMGAVMGPSAVMGPKGRDGTERAVIGPSGNGTAFITLYAVEICLQQLAITKDRSDRIMLR